MITVIEASPVGEAANLRNSWVMLDDAHTIVPLSRERILHTSPPRISLAIEPPNPYPGKSPFSLHCNSGKAFLTNQRVRLVLTSLVRTRLTECVAGFSTCGAQREFQVLFRSNNEPPGYARFSPHFWCKQLVRNIATGEWRRNTTTSHIFKNKDDVQGRWCL